MIEPWYSFSKALHLIGMVSWMAGLFYLVRIMVYHATALQASEPERSVLSKQYALMEWKVYNIILKPAVIITWSFGVLMLCLNPAWLQQGWMHAKLGFIVLLTGYTHFCKGHIRRLEKADTARSHLYYRALNEVPTILMTAIIFLAVFKSRIRYEILVGGLLLFVGLIVWGIRKANRKK
jgi:putative membrane protein